VIDPSGPFAVCPACGHAHRFVRLPLFVLTGASGAGKSAVCLRLPARLPECVAFENDVLWRPEFATPADDYRGYRNLCLRVAKNIGQAGRPVVLCGTAIPGQIEPCPERRYFAEVHYLALVADEAMLAARLRARPAWREAGGDEFVARMTAFNRWLIDHAAATAPPMALLDTSRRTVDESVEDVVNWVRARLASARPPTSRDRPGERRPPAVGARRRLAPTTDGCSLTPDA
jgi:hypothetical protein